MVYFDSAYLVKCYVKEPGWEPVRSLARRCESVACSIYGKLEVSAALHGKHREGELTQNQMDALYQQLDLDESHRLWTWLPITDKIKTEVVKSFRSLPPSVFLRTADALHLVTAKDQGLSEIYSNDVHLLTAARYFGIVGKNELS